MALHIRKLIPAPCTQPWGEMEGGGDRRFCRRCSKAVHDLSGLTQSELRRAIARREVQCVQLRVDAEGMIVFPTTLVPVTRLRGPATAATALAVLAACTPHVEPLQPAPDPVGIVAPTGPIVPSMPVVAPPEPSDIYMMGGAIIGDDVDPWGTLVEADGARLDAPRKRSHDRRGARERPRVRAKD